MKKSEKKTTAHPILRIVMIYLGLIALLEIGGQFYIKRREAEDRTGISAERILSPQEPLIGFGIRKNVDETMGYWHVTTNQWGFRGKENIEREKPKNEFRIVVLGGSTAFGWGVEDNESIPAVLQEAIDAAIKTQKLSGKLVKVINAAVPWYASWHESALLYFKLLEFSPDWVLAFNGLNDTAMSLAPDWQPIYQGYVDAPTRVAFGRRSQDSSFTAHAIGILEISPTFRYFYGKLRGRAQSVEGIYRPEAWDQYLAYVTRMKQLTESSGARFSLVYQPVMVVDKPLEYFEIIHNGTSTKIAKFAETFKQQYLEGEKRLLQTTSLEARSYRKIFESEPRPIYLDGLHYNPKGNRMIAQQLYTDLIAKELPQIVSGSSRIASAAH